MCACCEKRRDECGEPKRGGRRRGGGERGAAPPSRPHLDPLAPRRPSLHGPRRVDWAVPHRHARALAHEALAAPRLRDTRIASSARPKAASPRPAQQRRARLEATAHQHAPSTIPPFVARPRSLRRLIALLLPHSHPPRFPRAPATHRGRLRRHRAPRRPPTRRPAQPARPLAGPSPLGPRLRRARAALFSARARPQAQLHRRARLRQQQRHERPRGRLWAQELPLARRRRRRSPRARGRRGESVRGSVRWYEPLSLQPSPSLIPPRITPPTKASMRRSV